MFPHNAICSAPTDARLYLVGPHAGSSAQLLISDDVDVHDYELLQLTWVEEAAEGVTPVCVPVHLSNW